MPGLLFSGGIDSVVASGRVNGTNGSFIWENGPTPSITNPGTSAITLLFPTGSGVKPVKGALFVQVHGTGTVSANTEGGDAAVDGLRFTVHFSGTGQDFTYLLLETALPTP